MKTMLRSLVILPFCFMAASAQDRTTVTSTSSEISDNLDLKAVASIFGDSENLEDFERRLNDPKLQISNLDLNNDNQVDYLRVIESVEENTHLIIIQSVLDKDVYQDVATVEVEKGDNNQVQVQVVGDVFMYGNNYIYEPVYVNPPIIFDTFWVGGYHPYYSGWNWHYYPSYYYGWAPYPVYRYRHHVYTEINVYNQYKYVNVRRSQRAAVLYGTRRSNGYERQYPTRSFTQRNLNVGNRYELDQVRTPVKSGVRGGKSSGLTRNSVPRSRTNANTVGNQETSPRSRAQVNTPRASTNTTQIETPRPSVRTEPNTPRFNNSVATPRVNPQQVNSVPKPVSNTRFQNAGVRANVPKMNQNGHVPAQRAQGSNSGRHVEQKEQGQRR